jgi:C4-dicarboxylate-specific signal transduction histidine kinase
MSWKATNWSWRSNFQEFPAKGVGSIEGLTQATYPDEQRRVTSSAGVLMPGSRSIFRRYGISLFFVAVAFVSTLLLQHIVPYPFPFLFFAAVMTSAWFGGTGAGLFAVVTSTATVDYFFIPPFHSFTITATNGTYFAAFVVCALVASWVSAAKKQDEEALREARDELGLRVAERTVDLQKSNSELRKSIQQHEEAQQVLMRTQAELARLARILTMGELTASIAHEVNQPLTAVVNSGNACLEWLRAQPPNLDEARQAAETVVQSGTRAGAVMSRIRALFQQRAPSKDWFDINEAIHELVVLLQQEAANHRITIRTELSSDLPLIRGDRVQLQQVVLNLMMNGIDAMRDMRKHSKEIHIVSRKENSSGIQIVVEDCGVGISPETAEKIFEPFFTTKPEGIGMGLSISRSIVESHEGRLWAVPRPAGGAIFQFTIPTGA